MSEFKTDKLWVIYQNYVHYSPSDIIICDNETDARCIAEKTSKKYESLNCYLENKEAYDRDVGYDEQTRLNSGLYADPDDE